MIEFSLRKMFCVRKLAPVFINPWGGCASGAESRVPYDLGRYM